MKTIRPEAGDFEIRSTDNRGDRLVPVIWTCMLLCFGYLHFYQIDVVKNQIPSPFSLDAWLPFALWLIVFVVCCIYTAWCFLGVIRISVSSEKLGVTHRMWGEVIWTAEPIKLSTIKDVCMRKLEGAFRGRKWTFWLLTVQLEDGSTCDVAKFLNGDEADAFMARYVR